MNEDARVRESVATIVVTLVDVHRNGGDVDLITAGLLDEFGALLETQERAALALLAFAKLSADALAYSAEDLVPTRTKGRAIPSRRRVGESSPRQTRDAWEPPCAHKHPIERRSG
jgi:hypothetical protein